MCGRQVVVSGKLEARGWLLLLWRLVVDDCMFYLAMLLHSLQVGKRIKFYNNLQAAVSSVPSNECYVMLGDFNARVDSRGVDDDWWYERGPHGYGEINFRM